MSSFEVVVIDYGIGNVFSVLRALERIGAKGVLTSNASRIRDASRVILPGVGAYGRAANRLREMGLDVAILDYVATGKPFLGICVGMQLLMETGEEFGSNCGLGIIQGTVRKLDSSKVNSGGGRIPFIGWAPVFEANPNDWHDTPFSEVHSENTFYFVHSFQAHVANPSHRIAVHKLGECEITSAVRKDNVLGVQFHPERSARSGHLFLEKFLNHSPNECIISSKTKA